MESLWRVLSDITRSRASIQLAIEIVETGNAGLRLGAHLRPPVDGSRWRRLPTPPPPFTIHFRPFSAVVVAVLIDSFLIHCNLRLS